MNANDENDDEREYSSDGDGREEVDENDEDYQQEQKPLRQTIQQIGQCDFSSNILHNQNKQEEKRMHYIHILRKKFPLFVEDHDFVYRLMTMTCDGGGVDTLQVKRYLFGPTLLESPNPPSNGSTSSNITSANANVEDRVHSIQLYLHPYQPQLVEPNNTVLREHYTCCVCLNLMFDPTTLPCGHSGCLACMKTALNENHDNGRTCPMCKAVVTANPQQDLVVSVLLRTTMQHLFPDEYGKSNNDMWKIDIAKIAIKILECYAAPSGSSQLNDDQRAMLLNSRFLVGLSPYGIAYRIWKDSMMSQLQLMKCPTLKIRSRLYNIVINSDRQECERYSKFPLSWFTALTSPDLLWTDDQERWIDGCANFRSFIQARQDQYRNDFDDFDDYDFGHREFIKNMLTPITEAFDITQNTFLIICLPNHQIRHCFRRAGILFEEYQPDRDIYDILRMECITNLIFPLLRFLVNLIPKLSSVYAYSSPARVDDVLNAYNVLRATTNVPLRPVYGFGYPGIPRGLLVPGILEVVKSVFGQTQNVIDEVALSVMHDLVVTAVVTMVQHAHKFAKKFPIGKVMKSTIVDETNDDDLLDYYLWRYEKVDLCQCGLANIEPSASSEKYDQPSKRIRLNCDDHDLQTKYLWTSDVYYSVKVPFYDERRLPESDPIEVQYHKLVDASKETKRIKLLTLEDIAIVIPLFFVSKSDHDRLLTIIYNAVDELSRQEDYVEFENLQVKEELKIACKLQFAPELVFFMLQCLPEYSVTDTISMTIEALTALTVIAEHVTRLILNNIKEMHKDHNMPLMVTARNIMTVIDTQDSLKQLFPGAIRNAGYPIAELRAELIPPELLSKNAVEEVAKMEQLSKLRSLLTVCEDIHVDPVTGNIRHSQLKLNAPYLNVLAHLTPTNGAESPIVDNIFQRKIQAIDSFQLSQGMEFQDCVKSPLVIWDLRRQEAISAQSHCMPIFDPELIANMCTSLVYNHWSPTIPKSFLQVSLEAAELISVLIEEYMSDVVKKSRSYCADTETYFLRYADIRT